jgi:hypothetical protein
LPDAGGVVDGDQVERAVPERCPVGPAGNSRPLTPRPRARPDHHQGGQLPELRAEAVAAELAGGGESAARQNTRSLAHTWSIEAGGVELPATIAER